MRKLPIKEAQRMEEDLHRSLDSVMEVAAMQFLQLRPFSRMVAEEVALLRLLEEIAGGTLTIATRDVLKEVCSMKKHAMRGVTTMKRQVIFRRLICKMCDSKFMQSLLC